MASKGQKFDKYSEDIKEIVMNDIKHGKSINYISKYYNIPHGTVSNWHQKIIHPELNFKEKRGRKKSELTKEDWKERYEIIKKYQAFLMAQREKK
jgi:hypothetical protein